MKNRGEFIELNIRIPVPGTNRFEFKNHPFVIISNEDVYHAENSYLCAMITHSSIKDQFTFELTNDMVANPLNGTQQVRCHIVVFAHESEIITNPNFNKMKSGDVDRLVNHINIKALMG